MADLQVDLDGLASFASGLDRIRSQLDNTGDFIGSYRDDVGSDKVAGKLDDFEDHWDDGREKITSNAESLSSMVHESVETYTSVDTDLADAITESTQGGG